MDLADATVASSGLVEGGEPRTWSLTFEAATVLGWAKYTRSLTVPTEGVGRSWDGFDAGIALTFPGDVRAPELDPSTAGALGSTHTCTVGATRADEVYVGVCTGDGDCAIHGVTVTVADGGSVARWTAAGKELGEAAVEVDSPSFALPLRRRRGRVRVHRRREDPWPNPPGVETSSKGGRIRAREAR